MILTSSLIRYHDLPINNNIREHYALLRCIYDCIRNLIYLAESKSSHYSYLVAMTRVGHYVLV
jgi:hypothetical protein